MRTVKSTEKRLDAMDRLGDMLHFPAAVNGGATLNVMVTIAATWWIEPRYTQPYAVLVWIALVLALNLLPVLILRRTMRPESRCDGWGRWTSFATSIAFRIGCTSRLRRTWRSGSC